MTIMNVPLFIISKFKKEEMESEKRAFFSKLAGYSIPLTFLILMGWYNYLMVNSYNYTIFDLGLSLRLMYLLAYHHTIIYTSNNLLYNPLPFGKFIFVPLSIFLYLYNNILTPLIIQIVVISAGGYAVFSISRKRNLGVFISLALELAYFLYPSTYGFMEHGGNFQVLLEGFVLLGYMFYIQRKMSVAFVFFLFASLTNIWAPIIVLAFLLIDFITFHKSIIGKIYSLIRNRTSITLQNIGKYKSYFVFVILILVVNIAIFTNTVFSAGGFSSLLISSRISAASGLSYISGSNYGYLQNISLNFGSEKLPFLYYEFSPVLFLPILTPYFFLILIYFLISWLSPSSVYYSILQQYPYLFASFIFIGTIHFFSSMHNKNVSKSLLKKLAIIVLISSIISFCLFSPFSISNIQDGTVQSESHISKFDTDLTYGISLIPSNASVFIQNDLPQLMNRAEVYSPGYYNNQTVDYAVIIPFGFSPLSDLYSGYSPYWSKFFKHNSSYGIYENISGAIIYKLYYSGTPVYVVPYNQTLFSY